MNETPSFTPQQPNPVPRHLTRSRTDRKIAGVCGGLAEYFNVDPTLMRLLVVAAAVLPGPAWVAYIAAWIIMPEAPSPQAPPPPLGPAQGSMGTTASYPMEAQPTPMETAAPNQSQTAPPPPVDTVITDDLSGNEST